MSLSSFKSRHPRWVRDSKEIPSASGPDMEAAPISVDLTHLIYPINTEYEIFSVDGKRHTQGAVFVLNHKTPLNLPSPPAFPAAEEARRQGAILSVNPLRCIEIICNGETVQSLTIEPEQTSEGAWKYSINVSKTLHGSGWLALRCFEKLPDAKVSFAHTNPVFVDVPNAPLKPRRRDAEFFVKRTDEEIARNTGILPD